MVVIGHWSLIIDDFSLKVLKIVDLEMYFIVNSKF
jgi:hypothetical protein